ncbi:PP2C family protein-serine/threonine phosphatase [Streptomyces sp. bgisy031]|uniref:PP2C family protein-serine/threonine phosphatase n=1 Tax=Streptomyces sp. bgisy031 TaxID=3413772 RepID=UPI003D717604
MRLPDLLSSRPSQACAPTDSRYGVARPPAWVRFLPATLVSADLLLDGTFPQHLAAGFLLIPLPVVAAFAAGPTVTAAFTVLALALEILLAVRVGHLAEQHHVAAYVVTALIGIVGAALARQRLRQGRDLVRARTVAEALQNTLLRPVPAQVGPLQAAALYRPADARTLIGGDLYEVEVTPFGLRAVVGDVRGKGLAAVRTVAAVLGSFREAAYEDEDLMQVAARLDRRLQREAADGGDEELFVTAVLIEYQPRTGQLTVVNRGHLEPLLIRPDGAQALSTVPGLPLGLGAMDGAGGGGSVVSRALKPGEVLLLHTDGASEARNGDGAFYPIQERLDARFHNQPGPTPAEVVSYLDTDLGLFADRAHDDLALLALAL